MTNNDGTPGDFIPAGWTMAEGYQYVADGLRTALELPETELRVTVAEFADHFAKLARDLRAVADR